MTRLKGKSGLFGIVAALLGSAVVVACGKDGTTEPAPHLELVATGWAERGGELQLHVVRGDQVELAPANVTSSAPDIATVSGGIAHLHAVGSVTFSATVDGQPLSVTVEVALPPMIVFERVASGNRDIYTVYLDGQGLQQVSTSPADDRSPSTASGRVIFSSTRSGLTDLYALTAPGSLGDRVTTTTALSETEPALSPDGATVAFIGSESGSLSVGKLYLANGDGSAARRVTTTLGTAGSLEATPSWGPESDRVAFLTTHNGSADIWVYYVAGDSLKPLIENSAADVEPAWEPSGRSVAFASTRDAADADIYLFDIPTGQTARLTTRAGVEAQPAWLPDGRIVFTTYQGTVGSLAWIDPFTPEVIHPIPTGSGDSRKPVSIQWLSQ